MVKQNKNKTQGDAKDAAAGRRVPEKLLRSLIGSESVCMPCRYWAAVRFRSDSPDES